VRWELVEEVQAAEGAQTAEQKDYMLVREKNLSPREAAVLQEEVVEQLEAVTWLLDVNMLRLLFL
jgi:hypothetical protein